jgi:hypothetical protein
MNAKERKLEILKEYGSLRSWFGMHSCLHLLSCCWLACKKKSLWIFALAAELERPEVLVPRAFGDGRVRFDPKAEQVEIFEADVALVHAAQSNERGWRAGVATRFRCEAFIHRTQAAPTRRPSA